MRSTILRICAAALFLCATLPVTAKAQEDTSADEAAVIATIQRLFDGMRANDGDMVRSTLADGATLIRTEGRNGAPATSIDGFEGFVNSIASAEQPLDEVFWDYVVQVQDHLATVWTKYAFYFGETFSHCGYDAFILARSGDGDWKIAAIADTRESEHCELPPDRYK